MQLNKVSLKATSSTNGYQYICSATYQPASRHALICFNQPLIFFCNRRSFYIRVRRIRLFGPVEKIHPGHVKPGKALEGRSAKSALHKIIRIYKVHITHAYTSVCTRIRTQIRTYTNTCVQAMASKLYSREKRFVTSAMKSMQCHRTVTYAISKSLHIDTVHVNSSTFKSNK